MRSGRLFGDRPVGTVAVVEAPVSRSYARRARVALFVVTALVGLPTAGGLSGRLHPIVGLVFGWTALMRHTSRLVALVVVLAIVGLFVGLPGLRRVVVALAWCAIVRHR